mmetsp:Transcript_28757/g.77869  ORF Transcript_28757/g.77869 Transcript_28757/m.77869 type:complete len:295 (+) Transcript_28757:2428-3312(+)
MSQEIVGLRPSVRRRIQHVVLDQRVRNDQVRFSVIAVFKSPVRKIIVVGVGIVQESSFLDGQSPRVDAGLSLIQSHRPLSEECLVDLDRPFDVFPFDIFFHVLVVPPAVSVAGNFPLFLLLDGTNDLHVAFQSHAGSPNSNRNLSAGKQSMQSPESGPGTILVHTFDIQVALVGVWLGIRSIVRQEAFTGLVSVQETHLATFFVIDDKIQGNFCRLWPMGMDWMRSVPNDISLVRPVLWFRVVWMGTEWPILFGDIRENRGIRDIGDIQGFAVAGIGHGDNDAFGSPFVRRSRT